jgi:hypothetical protein
MTKKQSNSKPKNIKRPTPPPASTRPYSNPVVEGIIEGLTEIAENIEKKKTKRMLNPKDYLRTVTEGNKKPDRSFIWTKDSNEKPKEPECRILREGQNPKDLNKKVYCSDCKYYIKDPTSLICNKIEHEYDTAIIKMPVFVHMYESNEINNCKHYEEKFSFISWIKKFFE